MPMLSKLAGALLLGALITLPAVAADKAKNAGAVATVSSAPATQTWTARRRAANGDSLKVMARP